MVALFLIFGGTSVLHQLTIPPTVHRDSLSSASSLTFVTDSCDVAFWIIAILTRVRYTSLWFLFAFPWWWVMLRHAVAGPPLWVSWRGGLTPSWLAVWPGVYACCGPTAGCCYYAYVLSCVCLCDPSTVSRQAPLSMGFPRQEYWSGLPFPPPGDLPDPGIEPSSLASPVLAGGFFTTVPPGKPGWWCFLALVGSGEDSKTALATAGVSSGDGDSTNSHQCLVTHGSLSRLSSLWEALQRH